MCNAAVSKPHQSIILYLPSATGIVGLGFCSAAVNKAHQSIICPLSRSYGAGLTALDWPDWLDIDYLISDFFYTGYTGAGRRRTRVLLCPSMVCLLNGGRSFKLYCTKSATCERVRARELILHYV